MSKWAALIKEYSHVEANTLPGKQQLNEDGNNNTATNGYTVTPEQDGADKPGNVDGLGKNSNSLVHPPSPCCYCFAAGVLPTYRCKP